MQHLGGWLPFFRFEDAHADSVLGQLYFPQMVADMRPA